MKKTTLKEIAEALGISISTVSKALKNYPDVSKKTKEKVLELAKSVNYSPNIFAQSLRSKASKTIGVVIPTMVHYFFSRVIDAILKEAEKKGYIVIIMQSNENADLEKKQVDLLLSKSVDGILISLSNKTNNFEHLKKITDYNIPLIQFDRITKLVDSSKVIIDDIKASYDAVSYLINNGCRRIAYFRGHLNPQHSIDRFIGYKKALKDHNIEFDAALVYYNPNEDFEEGYANAEKLIKDHGNTIDAIHTITDLTAIGAINYLNKQHIEIPKQIAVIGFSNWFMSSVITPSLSSIEQHAYKMGETSAKILFNEIDLKGKDLPVDYQKIIIDTELILRDSTL